MYGIFFFHLIVWDFFTIHQVKQTSVVSIDLSVLMVYSDRMKYLLLSISNKSMTVCCFNSNSSFFGGLLKGIVLPIMTILSPSTSSKTV